ncbi:LlaJI family restriction endonuclease [Rufibacter aurantiacus]|uniref:LlaJI family restriction endonuclease n=1 Tax=Rufibacter aurantiacus TaxID=2817374 RepID=UPI001B3042A5|nr:LlaJI family restriction endonuclease [Rufibacter aurantiacus]
MEKKFIVVKDSRVVFTYVGVASDKKKTLCILPKYLKSSAPDSQNRPELNDFYHKHAQTLISVLKAYELNTAQNISDFEFYNLSSSSFTNEITLADFLLNDYVQNGLWFHTKKRTVISTEGEIMWERTIDNLHPVISGGVPFYFEAYTTSEETVYNNLITAIHTRALKYCSYRYASILNVNSDADFLHDFDLSDLVEGDYLISILLELGEPDYLTSILERELRVTYQEREIKLLKALLELINISNYTGNDQYTLYGKNKFEHVWEDAISFTFKNEYSKWKHLIPSPEWKNADGSTPDVKETLIPDVLKIFSLLQSDKKALLILDAKYYLLKYKKGNPEGTTPGVGDIVKQYFYEMVLHRPEISRIDKNVNWLGNESECLNILGYPAKGSLKGPLLVSVTGQVSIANGFIDKPIINCALNADYIFDSYTEGRQFTEKEINNKLIEPCQTYLKASTK